MAFRYSWIQVLWDNRICLLGGLFSVVALFSGMLSPVTLLGIQPPNISSLGCKRAVSLVSLANPGIESSSPTWGLMPTRERLYSLIGQPSVAGLGHGISPILVTRTDPRRAENVCLVGSLTDIHVSGGAEIKGRGRISTLEGKVEAGIAFH